jgi:predicted LPLAT superfamily acyltransferase
MLVMNSPPPNLPSNPGPRWGYRFLCACDRVLPEGIFRPVRALGTWIAAAAMPAQRNHSRTYLSIVLGRPPSGREVWRHFFAFEEFLMLKLRVAAGREHRCSLAPDTHDNIRTWLAANRPALLGTFHLGHSDLVGFLLGGHEHRRVFMIRQRVGNSHDTESLGARFGDWVTFIWVNEADNLLFALKDAVAAGGSIAMKCDRLEFSAKTEVFDFLGAPRIFPFTIYHLALIFGLPVVLSVGISNGPGESVLHTAPLFAPESGAAKSAELTRARAHFQAFLSQVETLLHADPFLWFNFTPLNPVAPARSSGTLQAVKKLC